MVDEIMRVLQRDRPYGLRVALTPLWITQGNAAIHLCQNLTMVTAAIKFAFAAFECGLSDRT